LPPLKTALISNTHRARGEKGGGEREREREREQQQQQQQQQWLRTSNQFQ